MSATALYVSILKLKLSMEVPADMFLEKKKTLVFCVAKGSISKAGAQLANSITFCCDPWITWH
jgi:hypothetical protein